MSQTFAIAPGTNIVNSASITFDLRGRTYVVTDSDTLVAASDSGNSPPHALHLDGNSVPENDFESLVGRLAGEDVDPADTLTFSTADTRFRIIDDRLYLAPGVSFDHEVTPEVRVLVTVRDTYGGELIQEFTIPVVDVNEAPHTLTVPESGAPAHIAGGVIGPVTALDPDSGDTLTYTVDDARFVIGNGELRLLEGQMLTDGEHVPLTVTATDGGGLSVHRLVNLRATRFASQRSTARIGRLNPHGEPTALFLAQCGSQSATGISLSLPATHNVIFGDATHPDEPVVLEVVDADANLDRAVADGLLTRFKGGNGDEEVIRLLETGIDTGIFTAVIGLTSDAGRSASERDDCRLTVRAGDQVRLDYVDARDALDQSVATASVRLRAVQSTTASITLFANAVGATESLKVHLQPGRCGGSVAALPRDPEGADMVLPAEASLQPASAFLTGDTVFVQVTDLDENRDSAISEQVEVIAHAGPVEATVVLTEISADSGVFSGYINTSDSLSAACALSTVGNTEFSVSYVDSDDAADSVRTDGVVTGFVRVFSATTGALLDGVEVSLLDAATGRLATGAVTGLDGTSESPVTVRSGQSLSDGAGRTYRPPAGAVLFPRIRAGRYRLQVVPSGSYSFPSSRTDAQIELVSAGRYHLAAGSRGADFVVDRLENLSFDIPLDPLATGVFVTKEASSEVIEVGDFVQYRVRVQSQTLAIGDLNATLVDQMPQGFRYRAGSARLDTQPIEPDIGASGTLLTFTIPPTSAAFETSLTYVAEASVATRQGSARNTVVLQSARVFPRPTAFADVMVRNSMLGDRGFLVGQVREGCDDDAPGVGGVRVLLENGAYALSDSTGRFHFEDLEAGTHVVQLDPSTIPESLETHACRLSSRIDRDGSVQFVNLAEGSIARVEFALTDAPPPVTEWSLQLDSRADSRPGSDVIEYTLLIRTGQLAVESGSVGMILPDGLRYVAASSSLDENPLPDPVDAGSGALTFLLPSLSANSRHHLKVHARALPGVSQPEVKAMVTLTTATGKHRSSAVSNIAQTRTGSRSLIVKTGTFGPSGVSRGSGAVMSMPLPVVRQNEVPYVIPPIDEGDAPEFSVQWLTTQPIQAELIWPREDYNPRLPVVPVVIMHPSVLHPVLSVDGRLVNPVAFTGTTTDHDRGLILSRWKDVPISEGNSLLRVQFMDNNDQVVQVIERSVHFGQAPVRAELVTERSYLVADGVNPPMLAIRFFDRQGRPARPGLTGEFSVNAPFAPMDKAEGLEVATTGSGMKTWQIRRDGLAFIQLEPTTRTGDVVMSMNFGDQRQEKLRARLKPGRQDLVVVGLAESRLGQGERPEADDAANRLAFYAKGMVRGDWLVTAAYDSDKDTATIGDEQLDPGQFYPLYGDGSEQRLDAVSQRKFYVKAERENLEIEAGDFNTGFERSELARYDRTLNGIRSSWNESGMRVQVFASDSADTHVQDVLRPDGTSGLYRLSRAPLSAGTENVSIVTRDRLHTERELERQTLMRYLDYSIDYDRGTLLFKQPIVSQDNEFNPVFIEVGYDVSSPSGGKDVVVGTRATVQLDDRDSELGVTILRDSAGGANLALNAIDLHMQFTPGTHLQLEAAQSSSDFTGPEEAVIASVQYRGEKAAGELYYREQDLLFGAGLAPATEADTRKYGIEGEYRVANNLILRGEVFRQATIRQDGTRDVASMESRYTLGSMNMRGILQSVREKTVAGESRAADLVGVGVARGFLDGRLGLRADSEFNLSSGTGSTDYPDRTLLGAEMAVTPEVTLLLEQELASTGGHDSRHSRVGVRARPWTGNSVESWLGQEMTEQGARLFSNTGLVQQWQVNQQWLVDAGFDQVKTLNGVPTSGQSTPSTFNPAAPPVQGDQNGDFTAWFGGATMRRNDWHVSTRLERHTGDLVSKWNWLAGAARQLSGGKSVSVSVGYLLEELPEGGDSRLMEARIGAAWRPDGSPWSVFNRLDLNITQANGDALDTRTRSITENIHVNWQRDRHEIGLVGGLRLANGQFDTDTYDGLTVLTGAQYRFDLNSRWDVGAQARVRRSMTAGVGEFSYGVEVGRTFARQAWVSLGYNFAGFSDDDFVGAQYSAQGPFLKFRLRFDQRNVERFLAFVGMETRPIAEAPQRQRR